MSGAAGDSLAGMPGAAVLDEETRALLLERFSGPPADPSLARDECLAQLFEASADAHPERVALSCGGTDLTYREVERRANRLAGALRARGVGPGALVGLWLPRGGDVFVALLAILKAGGGYVPLDPEYPADRVLGILADAAAATLVSVRELAGELDCAPAGRLLLDDDWDTAGPAADARVPCPAGPDDLAYAIFTSGSTGKPKGVAITHRNVCNLVRAEQQLFAMSPDDRVFQGFSVAFDASVEEIWLALAAGATLVVGTADMVRSGPALPGLLSAAGVTVLSCVPTLLSLVEEDIPGLRLLIFGGEKCSDDLARRWCAPGRRVVNTYGPTEATVIATCADLRQGETVTIGRPIANYRCYVLGPELQLLPIGEVGELCIGGVGVARGYLNRPEQTAAAFVANPFVPGERLYRSGDLARWTAAGDLEILGRADGQVKLRGFRIELSEIESVLLTGPGVLSAAVTLREDVPGRAQLVGYVVPRAGAVCDEDVLRAHLRQQLPHYMVPALIDTVESLPMLLSGKVDRRLLPPPRPRAAAGPRDEPADDFAATAAAVWDKLFDPVPVGWDDDFFTDLGGHSLLAAAAVSALRHHDAFADVSVADLYGFPTLRRLAAEFAARRAHAATTAEARPRSEHDLSPRTVDRRHTLCSLAQLFGFYPVLLTFGLTWLAPYITYVLMMEHQYSLEFSCLCALGSLLAVYPSILLVPVVAKWLLIGRYRAGEYPLWGWYFFRWWLVQKLIKAAPTEVLAGTPWLAVWYRLMGARIGERVHFSTDNLRTFDLMTIGDDSSFGVEVGLDGSTVEDGLLKLGPVTVGARCFVGNRSQLGLGAVLEDDSSLGNLSLLPEDGRLPAGTYWVGSPAQPLPPDQRDFLDEPVERYVPTPREQVAVAVKFALGILVMPSVYLLAIFPGLVLINYVARWYGYYWAWLTAPVLALMFIVLLTIEIAVGKWVLLGRVRPGRHSLWSEFYVRKWAVDQLLQMSLDLVGPLYATLYLAPWLRVLGAQLGINAEVSTASQLCPDLLTIGDESFVADAVSLGVSRVDKGWITVGETRIGRRTFLGNSAVVPAGTTLGDGVLLGVMSSPPLSSPGARQDGTTWLGNPPLFLPHRQQSTDFGAAQTYRPTRALRAQRLFIEYFRITLPSTCFVILTSSLLSMMSYLHHDGGLSLGRLSLVFPFLYGVCGIAALALAVVFKWLVIGVYLPREAPLWSRFVWLTELTNAMQEYLADPWLADLLTGSLFVCWFFRALGCEIGKRVYLATTELTEYDLIHVGDDAQINDVTTIQTHLFEDRVMKMSHVRIGAGCSVGSGSVVLYDAVLEPGAALDDLSLVMKGETLPAGTRWLGTPARRAVR